MSNQDVVSVNDSGKVIHFNEVAGFLDSEYQSKCFQFYWPVWGLCRWQLLKQEYDYIINFSIIFAFAYSLCCNPLFCHDVRWDLIYDNTKTELIWCIDGYHQRNMQVIIDKELFETEGIFELLKGFKLLCCEGWKKHCFSFYCSALIEFVNDFHQSFGKLSEWSCLKGIIGNKLTIKSGKPKEVLQIHQIFWESHIMNCSCFHFEGVNTQMIDDMAQKLNSFETNEAFLEIECEVGSFHLGE